jgi:hypothetical protein
MLSGGARMTALSDGGKRGRLRDGDLPAGWRLPLATDFHIGG